MHHLEWCIMFLGCQILTGDAGFVPQQTLDDGSPDGLLCCGDVHLRILRGEDTDDLFVGERFFMEYPYVASVTQPKSLRHRETESQHDRHSTERRLCQ